MATLQECYLQDPLGYCDEAGVAHIATTLMEAHDSLERKLEFRHHINQFLVGCPVVDAWALALDNSPPHVYHDAFDAGALELDQLRAQRLWLLELKCVGVNCEKFSKISAPVSCLCTITI